VTVTVVLVLALALDAKSSLHKFTIDG